MTLAAGDKWQGVYRFDNVTAKNGANLVSVDPLRMATASYQGGGVTTTLSSPVVSTGAVEIRGNVDARSITAPSLTVRAGGEGFRIPPTVDPLNPEVLTLNLTGALTLEAGATIDVSGRGYPINKSYPGSGVPGTRRAGATLGTAD